MQTPAYAKHKTTKLLEYMEVEREALEKKFAKEILGQWKAILQQYNLSNHKIVVEYNYGGVGNLVITNKRTGKSRDFVGFYDTTLTDVHMVLAVIERFLDDGDFDLSLYMDEAVLVE